MKITILASLVILAFSEDSALDTKILVSIPQGELSKELSSIKSLVKDLKSKQAKINTAIAKGVEQEEKRYKQLETVLEKIQVQVKDIQTSGPSTSAPVYTGVQRLLSLKNGTAKWDGDKGARRDVEDAFRHKGGCAGWENSTGDWTKPLPIMIWYEFPSAHVPSKFLWRREVNTQDYTTPKTWRFVGAKEGACSSHGSTWKPLCGDLVGDEMKSYRNGEDVECVVPKNARESFKCLGIRIFSTHYRTNNKVCLYSMKFWEISRA